LGGGAWSHRQVSGGEFGSPVLPAEPRRSAAAHRRRRHRRAPQRAVLRLRPDRGGGGGRGGVAYEVVEVPVVLVVRIRPPLPAVLAPGTVFRRQPGGPAAGAAANRTGGGARSGLAGGPADGGGGGGSGGGRGSGKLGLHAGHALEGLVEAGARRRPVAGGDAAVDGASEGLARRLPDQGGPHRMGQHHVL
jgi:hypothetical protein